MISKYAEWLLQSSDNYLYFLTQRRLMQGEVRPGFHVLWSVTPTLDEAGNYSGEAVVKGYHVRKNGPRRHRLMVVPKTSKIGETDEDQR
jgi:hypothetical protein